MKVDGKNKIRMEHVNFSYSSINIYNDDVINRYDSWESPTVIISDGPYGIKGFKGDLFTTSGLDEWYEPHIAKWSEKATAQTTLWFWATELGWTKVHPVLEKYGWEYRACNVWNKGIAHIAGNTNTKSLRQLPVVTEICVQYIKKPIFETKLKKMDMKEWLRFEWERTGLPFSNTNKAGSVKDAATRKWFSKDYLWYMPPADNFVRIAEFANTFGKNEGKPYFSLNGKDQITVDEWNKLKAKFYCPIGVTNVWSQPPVNGIERIKIGSRSVHLNQKPLNIFNMLISVSSDPGDLVWECFGGLCTGAIAAYNLNRKYVSAEINKEIFDFAIARINKRIIQDQIDLSD